MPSIWWRPPALIVFLAVAILVGAADGLLVRHYGIAMVAITPMVMLIGDRGLVADVGMPD
jgi:hypothetical protein